jgi:ECF sigma factor
MRDIAKLDDFPSASAEDSPTDENSHDKQTHMRPSPDESPERANVTQLPIDWQGGKKEALDLLPPLVYQKLRLLADRYLRDERDAATIQPTALVHEAYLHLVSQNLPDWERAGRTSSV